MLSLAHIQSKPLRWLWPNHFPLGKLSLLVGESGAGKSFVALDLAARTSAGLPWPLSDESPHSSGGVLLLTAENDLADTICPRLTAAGANLDRIMPFPDEPSPADDSPPFSLPNDLAALEQAIASTPDCRLVIIDPLTAFLPQTRARRRPDWPAIFKPLAALAARAGVAIVAVVSFIASTSPAANHRTAATLAAQAGPGCVWRVAADPQEPSLRWLLPIKNNLAPKNMPLAFELASPPDQSAAQVIWNQARSATAPLDPLRPARRTAQRNPSPDKASAPSHTLPNTPQKPSENPRQHTIQRTAAWLVDLLKSHGGLLSASQVRHSAELEHISPRILNLAREKANIHAQPSGLPGVNVWSLPEPTTA